MVPSGAGLPWRTRLHDRRFKVLVVAAIALVGLSFAYLVASTLRPPGNEPPPTWVETVNVQGADLGDGWILAASGKETGFPSVVDSSWVAWNKDGLFGGYVGIESTVELRESEADASACYLDVANASLPMPVNVSLGQGAVLFGHSGGMNDSHEYGIAFYGGPVCVRMRVVATGTWEDASGRPFSSGPRLADDFVGLARIVESRFAGYTFESLA